MTECSTRSPDRRAWLRALAALAGGCLLGPKASAQPVEVWTVKAVVLDKIVSFLEWPAGTSLDDPAAPFVFTVLGDSPLYRRAEAIYRRRTLRRHTVTVRHMPALTSAVTSSHVLFVSSSSQRALPQILATVRHRPILTVGDSPGMARLGVAVNLLSEEGKVRFEVNRSALDRAGIRASFRLLSLARLVDEEEP